MSVEIPFSTPKQSLSQTAKVIPIQQTPNQLTLTSTSLPSQPPPNSEPPLPINPSSNTPAQNALPTSEPQSEPPTPSILSPGASALNAVRLLDKLLGFDEEEEDRENQESRFQDGLDFYDISFDEVDDRISAFQEDEFVQEAFAKGMDLREYARQIESELDEIEEAHELDYTKQVRSFIDLHGQIQSCDQILGTMEELLSVFQSDLGNISGEIQSLQERSSEMNIKLRNRKAVEAQLNTVLEGVVIPPYMIRKITESDVDEAWLNYLLELNKKMTYVKSSASVKSGSGGIAKPRPGPPPIRAFKDVGPELERLRLRAAATIRDFFLTKIRSLRIPNTNIQILQQSVLLKYKDLHRFLMERHGEGAGEVRQTYVNTMKWYFYNHFERYSKGLAKLQAVIADKTDLIGVEESAKKGIFSTGKVALKDKTNVFALGDRIDTLKQQDAGVILVHVAEDKSQKYPYESLFRSFNLTLIDNASSEYLFIVEFFAMDNEKAAADLAKNVFHDIFEPTEKMGLMTTKQYIDTSYDAVGILLCIRINTQLTMELQRRRVPALESYTNATNMLLWPRFQHIMNLHVESVKKMAANKQVLAAVKEVHPHYVTRRYAEFAASILTLNEEYSDPNLNNSLQRLRNEVEGLLARMSNELQEQKNRVVFLINNYDLIATVLKESAGKAVEVELEHVNAVLSMQIGAFVDEELMPHFGNLVNFVKHAEQVKNVAGIDADRFEKISYEFNMTWRQNITSINASVIQLFSNFKNGTTVLHAVLGQLIVYYTRFCVLLEQRFQSASKVGGSSASKKQEAGIASWKQPPVGVQTVMVEIKKFRSNF